MKMQMFPVSEIMKMQMFPKYVHAHTGMDVIKQNPVWHHHKKCVLIPRREMNWFTEFLVLQN
jgi:hypothetical protein